MVSLLTTGNNFNLNDQNIEETIGFTFDELDSYDTEYRSCILYINRRLDKKFFIENYSEKTRYRALEYLIKNNKFASIMKFYDYIDPSKIKNFDKIIQPNYINNHNCFLLDYVATINILDDKLTESIDFSTHYINILDNLIDNEIRAKENNLILFMLNIIKNLKLKNIFIDKKYIINHPQLNKYEFSLRSSIYSALNLLR